MTISISEYFAKQRERQTMLRELHGTSEPIWSTQGNKESIPLSKIRDSHLQGIERMLRGAGLPWPDRFAMAEFWYEIIQTEMKKRGLKRLPRLRGVDPYYDMLEDWIKRDQQGSYYDMNPRYIPEDKS